MRNIWVDDGRPRGMQHESYFNYKRAKRDFRRCHIEAFEKFTKETYSDIDHTAGCDIRLFWKLVNKQRPRRDKIYPEITYKNVTATDPESVANLFASYYTDVYTPQKIKQ
jgi:hypothetical protein